MYGVPGACRQGGRGLHGGRLHVWGARCTPSGRERATWRQVTCMGCPVHAVREGEGYMEAGYMYGVPGACRQGVRGLHGGRLHVWGARFTPSGRERATWRQVTCMGCPVHAVREGEGYMEAGYMYGVPRACYQGGRGLHGGRLHVWGAPCTPSGSERATWRQVTCMGCPVHAVREGEGYMEAGYMYGVPGACRQGVRGLCHID